MTAVYGEQQLRAEARFAVWLPSLESVELRVEDATLQRLAFPEGDAVDCAGAQRYQRTEVSARLADLDATLTLTLTPTLTLTLTLALALTLALTLTLTLPLTLTLTLTLGHLGADCA